MAHDVHREEPAPNKFERADVILLLGILAAVATFVDIGETKVNRFDARDFHGEEIPFVGERPASAGWYRLHQSIPAG